MAKKKASYFDEIEKFCDKFSHLEKDKDIMLPTGIFPVDYGNGKRIKVYDEFDEIIQQFDQVGLSMGTVNGVTGESSTGKSALAYAAAGSVLGTYRTAQCHIIDGENSYDKERFKINTNLRAKTLKNRLKIHKTNISEEIADIVVDIIKDKLENISENTIETEYRDMFNEPITVLRPDVLIIDSWSIVQPRDQIAKALELGSGQEYSNNMQAATRAKINNAIVKLLNRLALIGNLCIILIHHTQDVIQAGFLSKAAQNMHMGGSKHIGNGKSSIYLSNNLFETSNMGKLISDGSKSPNYGIDGFVVGMKIAKSRTNATGKILPAVFDYKIGGFNKMLTLFHFACQNDLVLGSNSKCYFESAPDKLFSKKTFEMIAKKDPKLMSIMFDECVETLTGLLSNTRDENEHDESDMLSAFMF